MMISLFGSSATSILLWNIAVTVATLTYGMAGYATLSWLHDKGWISTDVGARLNHLFLASWILFWFFYDVRLGRSWILNVSLPLLNFVFAAYILSIITRDPDTSSSLFFFGKVEKTFFEDLLILSLILIGLGTMFFRSHAAVFIAATLGWGWISAEQLSAWFPKKNLKLRILGKETSLLELVGFFLGSYIGMTVYMIPLTIDHTLKPFYQDFDIFRLLGASISVITLATMIYIATERSWRKIAITTGILLASLLLDVTLGTSLIVLSFESL